MSIFHQEKGFYRSLLSLALPAAGASLLQNAVGLADTFMVGSLGDDAVAAIAAANKFFFIFSLLLFGLVSGASVLAAQYWGKRDREAISRIAGIVLGISLSAGFFFAAAAAFFPRQILSVFTGDPAVIGLGVGYLRLIAATFLTSSFSAAYWSFLRSIEKAGLGLAVQLLAFFSNTFFNAVFIFGLFGAPKMGVNGAALGTLLSRSLECLAVLIYAVFFRKDIRLRPRDFWRWDRALLRDFFRYSSVVLLNDLLWGIGNSLQIAVLGHISTPAMTAASVVMTIQGVVTVTTFGMASAAGVLVGKTIGRGHFGEAKRQCQFLLLLAVGVGLLCSAAQLLIRSYGVDAAVSAGLFHLTGEAVALMRQMLLLGACLFPVMACNFTLVMTLRSGGDTKVSALIDVGFMWLISFPAAALAAFVLRWPPTAVLFLLNSEELLKCLFFLPRMLRWRWMRNVTRSAQ
ncbi:MAG: MATE family efflux transporter [Oscillospiraceae bacterium]|nr:MATE family efflux transporter [Oscillospiraceae bacterium]